MKPAVFKYLKVADLAEARAALAEHGLDGKILAGGQSLVPSMNFRLARPEVLIDINGVAEIQGLAAEPGALVIGAVTRHAAFHAPVSDDPLGHMLADVVRHIAHYPIRQRGTFGGSLSHADPASEWCLVATTLGAEMEIHGPSGARRVPAAEFFRGTFVTAVQPDELLVRVRLPRLAAGWRTGFYEFSRRKGDFALAMALAALRVEGGVIREARLGLGGLAGTALRMREVEAALVGQPASATVFTEAAARVRDTVDPLSDIHGSAAYRRELSATVTRRALAAAAAEPRAAAVA
ncbi:MAG: molybdopterin dehydrogenase [Rhodovulum sulfidophilum]|uniref:Molybdopterin dehydrogenase n=1 Tax=Rhodovulum sulfidophilum TaxID=35806 RepID=A0A2W5Q9Y1_RHOSU|nr:MAG: molybdopterin dehydrogenase [Rhodovulum sulfidophilum]